MTWLSGSRSLCSFVRGTADSTGIAVANDMAVYAIRVGGWLSELAGLQRLVGLEEALTLFESVSFIGQLLFVAANALSRPRSKRSRSSHFSLSGWTGKSASRRALLRLPSPLSRLFGNGRMEREEARENKPCITLNMRSQIRRAQERKKASEKAMHASAPVLLMLWYSNIERFFQ